MGLRIAVDTGGTFTDVVLYDEADNTLLTHKLPSTPDDPARAVLEGIAALTGGRAAAVIHGSTVATNALLEGKGGRAAFVTTEGFEDTLHIGRQNRPDLYALAPTRPALPIERERCLGVPERLRADGQVIKALTGAALEALIGELRALDVEAVAVSLLHSYADPAHERATGRAIEAALPGVHVTLSCELLPEVREFERGATCVVNAVVAPKMGAYLGRLERALGGLRVMASAGGAISAGEARRAPVYTVLSGPAGGVVGALALAGADRRLVTFDMGGTSTDVALCDGAPRLTTEGAVGPLPVRVPMIDIHTVGAGGGSIAWVDTGGALRVGPQSVGADPGPACAGRQRGAPLPTVTDAHVVLGRLRPDRFLGGAMRLDVQAAREALDVVAGPLGLSVEEAALGILRVAEATMARAVKVISVQRGHDIREDALVCFGGAGGLHACQLAEELGLRRVIVPRHPGLLSALGMLFAHNAHTLSRAIMRPLERGQEVDALSEVAAALDDMRVEALGRLEREGFGVSIADRHVFDFKGEIAIGGAVVLSASADLRYAGQSHELTVPLSAAAEAFERLHERLYGYKNPERAIEVVAIRLRAEGRVSPPTLPGLERRGGPIPAEALERVEAWFGDEPSPGICVDRGVLRRGDRLVGPLIVTEYSSTVVVSGGWALEVGAAGELTLEHVEGGR